MAWKESTKETMREEFAKRVLAHEKTKAALCREYGISRVTGDKWLKRFLNDEPMDDRSRAPFHTPKRVDEDIENEIVEIRKRYPAIGATKIRKMMENDGYENLPSASTFNEIFRRNGLITKEASQAAQHIKRFEKSTPNEMWQMDFKGNHVMNDGNRCHPLNIIDDCTRMNLCCKPSLTETLEEAKPHLIRTFSEYGLPFSILCDNGSFWGTSQSTGFTRFEVWMMELGVLVLHGRIIHPQTQGKEERFNGSLKREFLKYTEILNIEDANVKYAEYREFYNNKRPHHALNLATPASLYIPSSNTYRESIEEWEYGEEYELRNVSSAGYITIRGQGYFLSEAFGGKQVAFRESSNGQHLLNLYFRKFKIGQIDVEKRVFTFKRAYLIDDDPRFSDRNNV